MGLIKQITAPIRSIVRFPLFQLAVVVALILFLQAADPASAFGRIFTGLDKLVGGTVDVFAAVFNVRSFTKSWLTSGFWIGYVYLACLLILVLARLAIGAVVDFVGRHNAFWLSNTIARERGIAAYRAWVPFERIRPPNISQHAMGRDFRLAARQQAALPAAGATDDVRSDQQCGRGRGARRSAPGVYAVSGADLAWRAGKNGIRLIGPARCTGPPPQHIFLASLNDRPCGSLSLRHSFVPPGLKAGGARRSRSLRVL